jgi:hypothetical protein
MSWDDGHNGTREFCSCRNCRDFRDGKVYILHRDGTKEWAKGREPVAGHTDREGAE